METKKKGACPQLLVDPPYLVGGIRLEVFRLKAEGKKLKNKGIM